MKWCPKCKNTALDNEANFCSTCGHVLHQLNNPYINEDPYQVTRMEGDNCRCRHCQNDFAIPKESEKFFCPECGYPHIVK